MPHAAGKYFIVTLCLSLFTSASADSHDNRFDLASRVAGSKHVFHGHVRSKRCEHYSTPAGDQIIITRYKVDVDDSLKGDRSKQNEIVLEGGTIGEITLRVSDMPDLSVGEEIVVFGDENKDGVFPHRRDLGIRQVTKRSGILRGESVSWRDIRARFQSGEAK